MTPAKEAAHQQLQQFFLETERLDSFYQALRSKLEDVEGMVQASETRMAGKWAELEFVSHYLEAILNRMSQAILFIDLHGIITTCNPAAEQILGYSTKELIFHSYAEFFDDEAFGFSIKAALQNQVEQNSHSLSWKNTRAKHFDLEVEARLVVLPASVYPLDRRPSEAPLHGLLILMRDITEETRLQETEQRFDRLKEIGELAAHLAHEIRNPLAGIAGFASLLRGELSDVPAQEKMILAILEGTEQLNRLVSNILNYARPFQMHPEKVEMNQLLLELQPFIKADPTWHPSMTVEIRLPEHPLFCLVDPHFFKSALLNLAVNALQAMSEGGHLTIHLSTEGDEIKIAIRDTGCGIHPNDLKQLFSPFFTTKAKGTGLGLAEVQKVILAHHGKIEVSSEVGVGSEFLIRIRT